jgi:hypothetical protein
MISQLPRGVAQRAQPMACRQANDAEIGLLAGLISVNSSF